LQWQGNQRGLAAHVPVRVYASDQVHTSIDRAIWIAGIGEEHLVRIPVTGALRGMDVAALEVAINQDREAGLLPAGVIACVGGTSVGATDDVTAVCDVAKRHGLFTLVRTLAISPEYLKTHGRDGVINYSEWSVPLGRRFRALKLWFLLRAHGLEGLRAMIRNHVSWSEGLAQRIATEPHFVLVSRPMLSLFAFRFAPPDIADLDGLNLELVNAINEDGRIYLTQTRVDGQIAIRFQAGSFETTEQDVDQAFNVIMDCARRLRS
jgi:aromatic-L-amino-acid decarboxylase